MREEDIRPKIIFDEFLRLSTLDAAIFFANAPLEKGLCPACNSVGNFEFEKFGFKYDLCPNCDTLYVNPRPIVEAFEAYYTESASSKYWATAFYKETAASRREKLWAPKACAIQSLLKGQESIQPFSVVDIGGGYGLFAEEYFKIAGFYPLVIEPGSALAKETSSRGIPVIQKFLEEVEKADLPSGPRAFTSFELFEHLHDPGKFLTHLFNLMNSGDLFIFTTLSSFGLDIQLLWEHSKSISPPHHLNFLNPKSVKILMEKKGFELVDISTPGKLDLDILQSNLENITDRFWHSFIKNSNDAVRAQLQLLISDSGWSSHMMVVAKKV